MALSLTGSATATRPAARSPTADQHHAFAVTAPAVGLGGKRRRIDAQRDEQRFIADGDAAGRHRDGDPTPRLGAKPGGRQQLDAARSGASDDGRRQRMLAATFDARGQPQQFVLAKLAGRCDGDEARAP